MPCRRSGRRRGRVIPIEEEVRTAHGGGGGVVVVVEVITLVVVVVVIVILSVVIATYRNLFSCLCVFDFLYD